MEDPKTGDPLFPPNFVTIHHLREQWFQRRQLQQPQGQERLETRQRPPPGEPPRRVTTPPFPPLAEKDQRKHPEQELSRRGTDVEREGLKGSQGHASGPRPSTGIVWAVRRNASFKEGSDGREATGSRGPKPSERPSRGECAGFGADEKAKSALVKDQRRRPEDELPRGETNTERERGKASPREESGSRPSPANLRGVRRNTSVKEGSGGRQATGSNDPKPSEKSSLGEYADFGAHGKAESASLAAVSVVAESAEQVKKTKELEKKKKKKRRRWSENKKNNTWKGKGGLNEDIVRAKEKGPRVEAKTEEVVVHAPAKKLFQRADSESENVMPESKEVRVEVGKAAGNASHVRAKAEGLNKQVWVISPNVEIEEELRNLSLRYGTKRVINPNVEIEEELRNLSLRYGTKRGGFQSRRSNRGDHRGCRVIDGKKQKWRVRMQSGDLLWARKEDTADVHAGESSS